MGGSEPEAEPLVVKFRGADTPGSYATTVRIVTQAGNTGVLSQGRAGEPLENLFYVDIPVTVDVGIDRRGRMLHDCQRPRHVIHAETAARAPRAPAARARPGR